MPSFYVNFPSQEFELAIKSANRKLNDIGSGKVAGEAYLVVKKHLSNFANDKSKEVTLMPFETLRDIQRVIAVLKQERDSASQTDNDILKVIIEDNSKISIIFKRIENFINEDNRNLITQKMLDLYYSRYKTFDEINDVKFNRQFKTLLSSNLEMYNGKNKRALRAQKLNSYITNGHLLKLLDEYDKSTSLEDIRYDLCMQTDHEIWHLILNLHLIETVKTWDANQYDREVKDTLEEIKTHRETRVDQDHNLIEKVAYIMLDKCMQLNDISNDLLNWSFLNIGDPRNHINEPIWRRINEEIFFWLRARLSQGDVREFLENMTDGNGDEIYQYRRQFWMQYIDYVQYAKVMLNPIEIRKLAHNNRDLFNRFNSSPQTYSKLNDTERSCIYIDFGEFKVIEGTHNAMLRFYKNVPINLLYREYDYSQFHNMNARNLLTHEFTHLSSATYSWQNKIRHLLNKKLHSNIILKDVVLPEDASGEKWQEITNRFFKKVESIS